MRLFIAILLPETVKEELCRRRDLIEHYAIRENGTKTENLHLTLAFLGDVTQKEKLLKIKTAISRLCSEPFSFVLSGLGRFMGKGEGLYFNDLLPCPSLLQLQKELVQSLEQEGFILEKRKFKPHLTLSRRTVLRPEEEELLLNRYFPPMKVPVNEICLMKSERVGGKLVYSKLYGKVLLSHAAKQEE